ncbi:MAG: hypothetical protein EP305_04355 [Bacteroidetes bacterium]|nr:MAG: hypothetical protein EP305_04355 [Bacteroidota bacterium]
MKNLILIIALLTIAPQISYSQEEVSVEDTTLYRLVKTDGGELIGYILSQDEREILFKTMDGRKIVIPQYVVKEVVKVQSTEFSSKGEYVGEDKFATRYFISTNGLPMKKGEHYVQWNLFGPDFQFAVSDRFGLGVMTSWLAVPIIGTAKYSFKLGENAQAGIGTMLGTGSWASFTNSDFGFGLALPFATLSIGNRKSNLALSGGYGGVWQGGQGEGRALFSIAGMTKLSPKFSLVFDSFIVTPGGERTTTTYQDVYNPNTGMTETQAVTTTEKRQGFALLIPGLRWHQGEGKAFQFGFTGIVAGSEVFPIPIPMVQWYRSL